MVAGIKDAGCCKLAHLRYYGTKAGLVHQLLGMPPTAWMVGIPPASGRLTRAPGFATVSMACQHPVHCISS